ncbi:hypothetical protein PAPYR_12754 [Paratrimastix pyriformis]|uniref:Uncharacterized protein n=1 Tax=Paratrimastix pyriformis TaxID=342808 RepID=A0ABQ8U1C9_9EUKA|nr:hypothetical protein PAPYR_12754 [Paratrimastix pyriformis]
MTKKSTIPIIQSGSNLGPLFPPKCPRAPRNFVRRASAIVTRLAIMRDTGGGTARPFEEIEFFEVVFRHHPKCFSMKLIDLHHQNRYRDVCRY